jgi:hypothetical protein
VVDAARSRPGSARRCDVLKDALEAAVWSLLHRYQATVPDAEWFMDDLLAMIDAYASGDDEHLTALRREVLHREGRSLSADGGQ